MYDLIIKNGHDHNMKPIEIAIQDGVIVKIADLITEPSKEVLVLENGSYVSAGWIDAHVHCYEKMTLYYDTPDAIGVEAGVTSVIDAGSTGEANIQDFYNITREAKTNVYALLNISTEGIVQQDELADLKKVNHDKNLQRIKALPDFIVGIKARMSKTVVGNNNTIPLVMAKALQKDCDHLPLMVHVGSAPPKLEDVLDLLDKGDVITHCYNGKDNGILAPDGSIKPFCWEAYRRGIYFDVGHGTDSFNMDVAKRAFAEGFICKTVSTDVYHRNRVNGPVYNMATTLSKMLSLGMSLKELIDQVTINPATIFKLNNKGVLKVSYDADLTIFKIENKQQDVVDSNHNTYSISKVITPHYAVVGGQFYQVKEHDHGLL